MIPLALFLALAASVGDLPQLRSVYGAADPLALALAPDEARLYVAEGAGVVELELPSLRELARVPVDAGILDMACEDGALWIAGGTQGLWRVELSQGARAARRVDVAGDHACLAVAADGERACASYGGVAGAELRVYEAASGERERVVELPAGTPRAVAIHGGAALVAHGDGGLLAVELDGDAAGRVTRGPALDALPVPDGFPFVRGHARDLALDGDVLLVAADSAGLVAVDLRRGLRPDAGLRRIQLPGAGGPFYAARVDAGGGRVALGVDPGPARLVDGAPWSSTGAMGWDLSMNGVAADGVPGGRFAATLLFLREGEHYAPAGLARHPTSAWRALALGRERVYELVMRHALLVRAFDTPDEVLARRRAPGVPAVDGIPSALDPDLLLFGMDSQGALARGLVRVGEDEQLALAPGTEALRSLGLGPGASWRGERPNVEWVLGDRGTSWALHRLEHGDPPRVSTWPLPRLVGPDGARASSYFFARRDGDVLLLTCAGLRHGLAVHSAAELTSAARETAAGTALDVAPGALLATHGPDEAPPFLTWGASVFRDDDGRAFAAVAAGSYGGELGELDHPARLVVVALDGAPRVVAVAHGALPRGQAVAVETARFGGRTMAFVADLAGRLSLFDLADPAAPRHLLDWSSPPSVLDGLPDVALDLALRVDADGAGARVFLAAGRRGVVCLDVTAEPLSIDERGVLDTPGWAAGLCLHGERLLVGDQKAGLRLYRLDAAAGSGR